MLESEEMKHKESQGEFRSPQESRSPSTHQALWILICFFFFLIFKWSDFLMTLTEGSHHIKKKPELQSFIFFSFSWKKFSIIGTYQRAKSLEYENHSISIFPNASDLSSPITERTPFNHTKLLLCHCRVPYKLKSPFFPQTKLMSWPKNWISEANGL